MSFSIAGEPVLFRPMEPGDVNFITATWLRSGRDACAATRPVYWDRETKGVVWRSKPELRWNESCFFSWQRPIVEQHLANDDIVIACDASAPSAIYGWACFRHGVPIYVYVMAALRGNGLRGELLRHCKGLK